MPSQRVRPARRGELRAVEALDEAAFGVPRTHLFKHFSEVGDALVLESGGHMDGFAIRRKFGRGWLIGPVVAAALNDALELIGASIVPGFNRIDLTSAASSLTQALVGLGFENVGAALPMLRGEWPPSAPGRIYAALASQALG